MLAAARDVLSHEQRSDGQTAQVRGHSCGGAHCNRELAGLLGALSVCFYAPDYCHGFTSAGMAAKSAEGAHCTSCITADRVLNASNHECGAIAGV